MTATYSGDGNYLGSSGTLHQAVVGSTTVTLTSDINPSVVGQSVTFTATVSPDSQGRGPRPGRYVPARRGDSAGTVGTPPSADSDRELSTTALPVGSNQTVTAVYSGDPTFAPAWAP